MKISIMQMYKAMNKTPKFTEVIPTQCAERIAKGKANRSLCLQLIKAGEWCINKLSVLVKVHRSTLLVILKEFSVKGLIELVNGNGKPSKIVNVL